MTRPGQATCGVPGCRQRAVFARSTEEATVVLCGRHLERWREQQPDEPEDGGGELAEGRTLAEAAA